MTSSARRRSATAATAVAIAALLAGCSSAPHPADLADPPPPPVFVPTAADISRVLAEHSVAKIGILYVRVEQGQQPVMTVAAQKGAGFSWVGQGKVDASDPPSPFLVARPLAAMHYERIAAALDKLLCTQRYGRAETARGGGLVQSVGCLNPVGSAGKSTTSLDGRPLPVLSHPATAPDIDEMLAESKRLEGPLSKDLFVDLLPHQPMVAEFSDEGPTETSSGQELQPLSSRTLGDASSGPTVSIYQMVGKPGRRADEQSALFRLDRVNGTQIVAALNKLTGAMHVKMSQVASFSVRPGDDGQLGLSVSVGSRVGAITLAGKISYLG